MRYCFNIECDNPANSDTDKFCQNCGFSLFLKNRYQAIQILGKGGFGRTFVAIDEDMPSKSKCVVKQLYFSSNDTENYKKIVNLFYKEAVRLEELGNHPQIPSLLAHFQENQQLYLVQSLVPGLTLGQELRQKGVFSEDKIWELLKNLLPVLQFIHEHNIIHRDIKPANIIRNSENNTLFIIDFGIAKVIANADINKTGTIIGSPEYMSPEQIKGKAIFASDVYSLGVTCIYLMTGIDPCNMFDIINDRWAWRDFLPPGTQVSYKLGNILDKMLENALSKRYKSAAEVLQAIDVPKPAPIKTKTPPPPKSTSFIEKFLANFNINNNSTPDTFVSQAGIDYRKLRDLLAQKKWQAADEETWKILCQIFGKSARSFLHVNEIEKLPCEDLQTIDNLWNKYSKGRFGFSVQKQIYEMVKEDYGKFCTTVGWTVNIPHDPYMDLKFHLSAPMGHLPSRAWVGGYQWWRHAEAISSRLAICNISGTINS